jgi:hypothetical protein
MHLFAGLAVHGTGLVKQVNCGPARARLVLKCSCIMCRNEVREYTHDSGNCNRLTIFSEFCIIALAHDDMYMSLSFTNSCPMKLVKFYASSST